MAAIRKYPLIKVGQVFGRLTVVGFHGRTKQGKEMWSCLCKCGNPKNVRGGHLNSKAIRSCGCLNSEMVSKRLFVHGHAKRGRLTSEYRCWAGILDRCLNPSNKRYPSYGGRGIGVDPQWAESFEAFFKYMGKKPGPEYSIDRIDNDKGYYPGNVRWATTRQQNRNRRSNRQITTRGQSKTLAEWAESVGMMPDTLRERLRRGWSIEHALSTPVTH